jgi:Ca2+-binding RTX toxin-like protein
MDNRQWVVDAEKSWSFSSRDNNTLRFEVRKGDRFSDSAWTDPAGVERAEINDTARYSTRDKVSIAYQFMIEPGPTNSAKWLVMGQLHSNTSGSPPIEIKLEGNDKMVIYGNYESSPGRLVYQKLYQDSQNIVRGKWYTMKMDIKLDASGGGYADIWRDGQKIVDYNGKLGYVGQTHTYWREGAYRSTPTKGETFAINYKNHDIETGPNANAKSPGSTSTPVSGSPPSATGQTLVGNTSANTLTGGSGNDTISGGLGSDVLKGGAGRDTFVFNTKPGSSNIDRITDFNPAEDTIRLENAVMTKLGSWGGLAASKLRVGTKALDGDDHVVYNSQTGALYYDYDGSGSGAAAQIATLSTGLKMSAANFYII